MIEEEKIPEQKEKEKYSIETVEKATPETLRALEKIEEKCFPYGLRESVEEIEEYFKTKGIQLLAKEGRNIIGYLTSLPAKEIDFAKKKHKTKDTLWVWSVDILPEKRDLKIAKMLYDKLMEEAGQKGYKKLAGVVRVKQHLSNILQKRMGWRFIERYEDWYESGEPFDYLEKDIE